MLDEIVVLEANLHHFQSTIRSIFFPDSMPFVIFEAISSLLWYQGRFVDIVIPEQEP